MYYVPPRSNRRRRNPILTGCFLTFFGLILLAIGIFQLIDTLKFLPGALSAQGTIIHCTSTTDNDGNSNLCDPTVSFKTQTGQSISFISSTSSSTFHEGDTIQVRYHPNNPHDGRIGVFGDIWLLPLLLCGGGLILILIGPFLLLSRIIRRRVGSPNSAMPKQ